MQATPMTDPEDVMGAVHGAIFNQPDQAMRVSLCLTKGFHNYRSGRQTKTWILLRKED